MSGIVGGGPGKAIFGDIFLRAYYAIYKSDDSSGQQQLSVSLAPAKLSTAARTTIPSGDAGGYAAGQSGGSSSGTSALDTTPLDYLGHGPVRSVVSQIGRYVYGSAWTSDSDGDVQPNYAAAPTPSIPLWHVRSQWVSSWRNRWAGARTAPSPQPAASWRAPLAPALAPGMAALAGAPRLSLGLAGAPAPAQL